jgi:glycosyltransferase involved in cell wall biosynthesis
MAAYNGEKYIKAQIDSILCQISKDDELIISDDGSTDNTLEIVKACADPRIKVFENYGMHGYAHNFENALRHAAGDYIFLSDQDDVWLPHKVQTILPHLKKNNMVVTDAYITDENLKIQKRMSDYRRYKKGYMRNLYKSVYMGCTSAFNRQIKDYCLPFPKNAMVLYDYWFGLLCELKFNVVYIPEPLVLYRRHQYNVSGTGSPSTKSFFFKLKYRSALFFETVKRVMSKELRALTRQQLIVLSS